MATFDYGAYIVERWEPARDGRSKEFLAKRPNGAGGWITGVPEGLRTLYRLKEALALPDPIVIPGGEGKADALLNLGIAAVAYPFGEGSWTDHYRDLIPADQEVVLLPDRDEAGQKAAAKINKSFQEAGRPVRVAVLPGAGNDVIDFIREGGTAETIKKAIAEAELWAPAAVIPPRVVELIDAKAPTLPPEAYDLAPEPFQNIIRFYEGRTEAPDSFLLYSLATWAGALFGRSICNPYSSGGIPPLLNTILVAPAGRRKTTADNIIRRAIIPPDHEAVAFGVMERRGTIGSGPALLEALAAAEAEIGAGATTIWRAPEWSSVLRAAEREGGRDLVPMLLGAFDGFTDYTHAVRNKKESAGGVTIHLSHPGLAILSTAQESMLRAHLTAETVGLGLASRLLMVYHGAPVEAVPFPERAFRGADYSTVNAAAGAIRDAAKFWRDLAKGKPDGIPIEIPEGSPAEGVWEKWYRADYEKTREAGNRDADRAAELLVRIPEYARRLALIRAAVEQRDVIDSLDIQWGVILAEFAGASATFLCRGAGVGETRQDARTRALLEVIHGAGGEWFKVRDLYRNRRAASNAREAFDLIRSLHDAGAVEFREGTPRKKAALVRCCCGQCDRGGESP